MEYPDAAAVTKHEKLVQRLKETGLWEKFVSLVEMVDGVPVTLKGPVVTSVELNFSGFDTHAIRCDKN